MPQTKTIAILGAGITGLMNAYMLSCAGHKVRLYDPKGFPAENASWIAGGMLAPYSEIEHMDTRWVDMGLEGIEIWRDIAEDIDIGFIARGSLLLAHAEDRYILERFKSHLPEFSSEEATPSDVEPSLGDRFTAGTLLRDEAHINPQIAMRAIIEALKDKIETYKVALEPEDIEADFILDCRGMAANDPGLRGVKGEIVLVENKEFTLTRPVRLMHPRYPLYIVPRPNHVFMIGATIIESDDSGHASLRSTMELMSALYSLSPSFGEAKLLDVLSGVRPSYADNLPRVKVNDNVISINGTFRHGYLLAPIMAEAVKEFINGKHHEYWPDLTKDKTDDDNKDNNQRAA